MHAHASKYRWFRWFRVPGGCSSTRSAAVMNTRRSLTRFSRERRDSRSTMKLYIYVALQKEKRKNKRRSLVIDGSKGPHRKIVDAHPWRQNRSRMDSYIVVSTRRKTGMDLATRTDDLSTKWADDDPRAVHLGSHRHSSRGVKIFHGIARYFKNSLPFSWFS